MPKGIREPIEVRFWRFVNKTAGCWLWFGGVGKSGYGLSRVNGQSRSAHRIAWELVNGPIPDGLWVLHGPCDNRRCVNPDHLYLGDRARNMRDAHERGRINMKAVRAAREARKYQRKEVYPNGDETQIIQHSVPGVGRGEVPQSTAGPAYGQGVE